MDAMETIKEMHGNIDPVKQIDPLISFIENQLHKMKTQSEAGSSSSDGRENACRELLLKILELAKGVKQYSEQIPGDVGKLCNAVGTIVDAVICCDQNFRNVTDSLSLSSLQQHWDKDVFLSHSGKQKNFIRQLHLDLTSQDVSCFFDEDRNSLPLGQNFPRLILNAAETCKIAVVVISKEFIGSKWPMQELSAFISAKKTGKNAKLEIIPIFFQISPSELSRIPKDYRDWQNLDVSDDTRCKWQDALKEVRSINGLPFSKDGNEVCCREQVVKKVCCLLRKTNPHKLLDFEPVGIEEQVREVKALLDVEGSQSALAVIVCGFGGVGKTTLALSVVQSLDLSSMGFKCCRVAIDETVAEKTSHIMKLQKDILYDLDKKEVNVRDTREGRLQIQKALKKKSCLLFIDNVVDKNYIPELLPQDLLSGEESIESNAESQKTKLRILVTSREKDVKAKLNIKSEVHAVRSLSKPASQHLLFKTIVQGKVVENKDFDERCMIDKVADACKGVPLLLSVFGEYLRAERKKDSYQEVLEMLQEGKLDSYRDEDLGKRLMFVYHKIRDEDVKEAFLDICTYFHGWEWNLVADIVDPPKLEDLRRKMLVSKSGSGEVIVHDILRLMGMKDSRLTRFLNYKELSDALPDNLEGFGKVKGISLVNGSSLIKIQSKQLDAMHKSLRVLMIGDWVTVEGPCEKTFTNLRYLHVGDITAFPFKDPSRLEKLTVFLNRSKPGMNLSHLPSSIKHISHEVPYVDCDQFGTLPFEKLRCLKSFIVKTHKSVDLPEELHLPPSLVNLKINRCKNLPKDIGHLTALESVILDRSDLESLPQGFGQLKKLRHLSMDYCSKLTFLPEELGMLSSLEVLSMKGCGSLKTLPEGLGGLLSLQTLAFSECINLHELPESIGQLRIQSLNLHKLVSLNELPKSIGNMSLLKDLSLESCHSLTSLPKSFAQLKMLESLKIIDCSKLRVLSEDFGKLRCLNHMAVETCHLLKELPHGFGALPALKTFTLRWCNNFMTLPRDFGELTSLEELSLYLLPRISRFPDGFGNLKKLSLLNVECCDQLKTFSDDFENMATLERLSMRYCFELDGAMMEKIVKLRNCYMADIDGSKKMLEKWEHMLVQGETEHPIVIFKGWEKEEEEMKRAIRVSLLHGKCMELKNENGQLMERSSLLVGLEEGTTATVALIMLPINMQSHQQDTIQRYVEMARQRADSNGSGKLQVVCLRKVDLKAQRPTATEEEERAEEEAIRQILKTLAEGSCVIPSTECKRVKVLTCCCDRHNVYSDQLTFLMANVGVDIEGRKSFENLEFTKESEISVNSIQPQNSIQNFINSICQGWSYQSQSAVGESKTREFIEALKENRIEYLHTHNNTNKVVVDDLHGKAIGFIICDFKFLEAIKLQQIYKDLQEKDSNFIVIWIPVLSKDCGHGSYTRLILCMPWATFPLPHLVNAKFRDPHFVVLDKDGEIANPDALSLLLAWGAKSYPFTRLTIPESFSLVESESCLEFLLHGMNIVGRKPMRSKMTFLFAYSPYEWLKMKSKLEELTRIHGSFEVLYVGKFNNLDFYHHGFEDMKQDYEDATQNMRWASLSFSDMIMFRYRCNYLARKEGYQLNKDSNILMETLHGLAKQFKPFFPSLVLVDNCGVVTRGAEEVVQMICEQLDGEGMGMRKVKDEVISSLRRGECSPVVRTFFTDEIRNHPQHPQHPITFWPSCLWPYTFVTCDACGVRTEYDYRSPHRSYRCRKCNWKMCGNCWMLYANQQVEELGRAEDN